MNANNVLCDFIGYLGLMGKSKNIAIDIYDEEAGILVLRNTKGNKVNIKINKGSDSFDIGIFICPYKNSNVEVLHPYKKHLKGNINGIITVVDEAFKEVSTR